MNHVELVHVVSTLFMAAVIWFVQLVHYPLFAHVGPAAFPSYEAEHVRRITWIVMPAMLLELGSSVALVVWGSRHLGPAQTAVGLGLVAVIWASTGLVQVPLHGRLSERFNARVVTRLVATNWVRTAAWTARASLVVWGLSRALG